jgi:hypothetical protein
LFESIRGSGRSRAARRVREYFYLSDVHQHRLAGEIHAALLEKIAPGTLHPTELTGIIKRLRKHMPEYEAHVIEHWQMINKRFADAAI